MKEKLKKSAVLEKWFYTQSPLVITRPALRETLACLSCLAGGFVLSCGRLADQPVPFVLGLLVSAGGGLRGLCVLVGAVLGYLLMQPFFQGLEMTSMALLTFVAVYLFGSLWVTKQRWFRCLVPGLMSAAVGSIFLFSRTVTPLLLAGYVQGIFLAALSPLAFDALLQGKKRGVGSLAALCFFVLGAAKLPAPWGMNWGLLLSAGIAAGAVRRGDPGTAAALGTGMGLALDGALMTGGLYTLCLGAAALAGCGASRRHWPLRLGLFAAGFSAGALYTGAPSLGLFLSLGLGTGLSLLLPAGWLTGREESAVAQSALLAEERLSYGQAALRQLYDAIGLDPEEKARQERSRVFDQAAARVCRGCGRYHRCWEKNSAGTYQLLRDAMEPVLERGEARREDFPEEFVMTCRQLDGFLVALNQAMDEAVARSKLQNRAQEARIVASRFLLHLSAMLEKNARLLRTDQRLPEEAYAVKLGVSAQSRHGARVSGDRGLSFHTGDGRLYVLLCDGMGTGEPAARESLLAVDTLAALIQSGLEPEAAMELLNGTYLLRDSGGFSTVDILELSLVNGQGSLYKWGAAPSYLRTGGGVKKLGTAAPPPGLGVGSVSGAEVIRLSLWGGDLLALISDGIPGDQAEGLIRDFDGEDVKALSSALVALGQTQGAEDDMTAAVIRLSELQP